MCLHVVLYGFVCAWESGLVFWGSDWSDWVFGIFWGSAWTSEYPTQALQVAESGILPHVEYVQ